MCKANSPTRLIKSYILPSTVYCRYRNNVYWQSLSTVCSIYCTQLSVVIRNINIKQYCIPLISSIVAQCQWVIPWGGSPTCQSCLYCSIIRKPLHYGLSVMIYHLPLCDVLHNQFMRQLAAAISCLQFCVKCV